MIKLRNFRGDVTDYSSVCNVLTLLTEFAGRRTRVPGGDPMEDVHFKAYIDSIRASSAEVGECSGRVLRLKPFLSPDTSSARLDHVLNALLYNWRVEVLYIQNFEKVRTQWVVSLFVTARCLSRCLLPKLQAIT